MGSCYVKLIVSIYNSNQQLRQLLPSFPNACCIASVFQGWCHIVCQTSDSRSYWWDQFIAFVSGAITASAILLSYCYHLGRQDVLRSTAAEEETCVDKSPHLAIDIRGVDKRDNRPLMVKVKSHSTHARIFHRKTPRWQIDMNEFKTNN